MIGILGGMGTQAGLDFAINLQFYTEEKLTKNILYLFCIINQIFLDAQSLLVFRLKIYQIDLQIKKVIKNIR